MGNYPFTFDSDKAMTVLGVPGRLTERTTKPGDEGGELWFKQRWISHCRPVEGYGKGAEMRVELRFDSLGYANSSNGFAITADVETPASRRRGDVEACGCLHEDIAKTFPELEPLIRFHLFDTGAGPMHGVANAVYHAGDRDCHGLRKGERRQIRGPDGVGHWELVAVNGPGVLISSTPTGDGYREAATVPLFILEKSHKGDAAPAVVPELVWKPLERVGEGKARDFDAARRAAAWPDATDADLSLEPELLRSYLEARVPGLLDEFRAAMEGAGLSWSPATFQPETAEG